MTTLRSMGNKKLDPQNVYFYAVDPGAFAVLSPIVEAEPANIKCVWLAEGYARKKLSLEGIDTTELDGLFGNSFTQRNKILVLGSQLNFERTVDTLKRCSSLGIKTIFVFDHWCNYSRNFASASGSMVIPTLIFAIDDYVKLELIDVGINKDQIVTIGHPGVEHTVKAARSMDSDKKKVVRKKLNLGYDTRVILVALELMSLDFNPEIEYGPVLKVMEALRTIDRKHIQIVVRLHPKQSRAKFCDFLDSYSIADSIILCPEDVSAAEILSIADIVIGVNSIFLISALTLGIPTISLKLYAEGGDRKTEIIPHLKNLIVNNTSELTERISEKLNHRYESNVAISSEGVRKAWGEIGILLSQDLNTAA